MPSILPVFLALLGCQARTCASSSSVTATGLEVIQYTTSGPESQVLTESTRDGPAVRPIDKGLKPLYLMTDGFLDLIQPSSKVDWIDDPRFDEAFRDGDIHAVVEIIFQSIQTDWKFWASHYLGFTVVIAFGVFFIVAMPIVALVFCCCRLRGRCCGKPRGGKKNSDGIARAALAILLIILTTVVTAGVVSMFMTNELLRQQTSSSQQRNLDDASGLGPDGGLLPAFVSSLRRIETYISRTFEDIKNSIIVPIKKRVTLIRKQLLEFPERARDKLQAVLDPGKIFLAASSLSDSLKEIGDDLGIVKDYMDALRTMQSQLNSSIMQSKMNILNALPSNCHAIRDCNELKNTVNRLNVTVDFSQSENASSQVSIIRSIINSDFQAFITEGKEQFRNMSDALMNSTREGIGAKVNTFLADLDKKLDESLKETTQEVEKIRSQIVQAFNVKDAITILTQSVRPTVETYGNFRYYVGIALSCVLLLITVCIYLGLCFGVCGEEAGGGDARFCNRGVGASFLMAGIGLTFIFASLLMSAAIVLFVFGGASYTEVCRPVLRQENKAIVKIGERILALKMKDKKFNFTILSVLSDCENDRAIYEALNLGDAFNFTKELDQMRGFIADSVGAMSGKIQMNFSSIVIARKEILDMLIRLRSVTLDDFQFSSFEFSLSQPATNYNVTSLARDLFQFSKSAFLNRTQQTAMSLESERLLNMSGSLIDPMKMKTKQFKEFLSDFKKKIVPRPGFPTFVNKSEDLTNSLTSTQQFLRTNLSGLISDYLINYIGDIASSSVLFVQDVSHEIQHNAGRCRVLYDVFRTVAVSACSSFLSPFNGFWFSILWCLVLSVPSLVLSVHLIALYRKREDYLGSDSKSLDDPIPRLRRHDLPVVHGHQNPVFDGSDDQGSTAGLTQPLTPLGRVLSDPGFTHPLYSGQISAVRPGRRQSQRHSGALKL